MTTDMHKAPSVARNTGTSGDYATSVARYDLSTSEGGRRYVSDFFATELRRHDFTDYIATRLAADFACALAQHLAATGKQQVGQVHPDDVAVDAFAAAMKAKMADARAKGRGGWKDRAQCSAEDLARMLRDHVEKGDPRDVANFCMMLHQRGESIIAYADLPYMSEKEIRHAALAAAGKQQVGEVQGDAHVVVLREMRARLTDAGSPARTAALDAAIAALAAQPSPAGQGAVPCATSASHALRVAYRHLDMVSMRVSHCKDAAIIESAMKDVDTFDLNAAISALAARQPGAQADEAAILRHGAAVLDMWEGDPNVTGYMGDFKDACAILEVLALHVAPPAQGTDLGQQQDAARWRWVREQNGVTVSVEEADDDGDMAFVSGHTPEELDAAIDGQRDAAPGVDRG